MKLFSKFFLFLCASVIALSACVDNDDSHAEATVSFQGVLTLANYTLADNQQAASEETDDQKDEQAEEPSFDYKDVISEAFDELGITGAKSVIEEKAKVSEGSIAYAEYVCAMQAAEKIQKKIDNISINDIKNIIFSKHQQEMNSLGFESAEDIPFETFYVEISYYSSVSYNEPMIFQKKYL